MKNVAIFLILFLVNFNTIACYADFSIENNKIIFKDKNKTVKILNLKPKTAPNKKGGYFIDKVYHNQDYILVYRNYNYLGGFCHTPKVEKIEIYDHIGNNIFNITKGPRKYVGLQFIFSEDWVVILNSVEGGLSGFAFINMKNRLHKYIHLNKKGAEFIHAFKYETGYTKEKDVI